MSRRFPHLSRPAHHVSAGETVGALIGTLAGAAALLFVVWLVAIGG